MRRRCAAQVTRIAPSMSVRSSAEATAEPGMDFPSGDAGGVVRCNPEYPVMRRRYAGLVVRSALEMTPVFAIALPRLHRIGTGLPCVRPQRLHNRVRGARPSSKKQNVHPFHISTSPAPLRCLCGIRCTRTLQKRARTGPTCESPRTHRYRIVCATQTCTRAPRNMFGRFYPRFFAQRTHKNVRRIRAYPSAEPPPSHVAHRLQSHSQRDRTHCVNARHDRAAALRSPTRTNTVCEVDK